VGLERIHFDFAPAGNGTRTTFSAPISPRQQQACAMLGHKLRKACHRRSACWSAPLPKKMGRSTAANCRVENGFVSPRTANRVSFGSVPRPPPDSLCRRT